MEENPEKTKQSALSNHYFSDEYRYTGKYNVNTKILLTQYNSDFLQTQEISPNTESFHSLVKEDCINWFRVRGLMDSHTICRLIREFGMQSLDERDILIPEHIVKIDDFDERLFIVLGSCFFDDSNRIISQHICVMVKGNTVFTFTELDKPIFENVVNALEENTLKIRDSKSGVLLAFIMNSILALMVSSAIKVEKMLEKLEKVLLQIHQKPNHVGWRIQQCRHANLILRKNTKPLKEEFYRLMKPQEGIIDESMFQLFNELSDQLEYILITADINQEVLSSLENLYISNNDLKTNAIMKRLTIVSTLFIPITFLVGLWGMNFKFMPELDWKYGYLIAWGVLIFTAVFTWCYMKRKKWF